MERDLVAQQQAHREAATKLEVGEAYEQWLRRSDTTDQLSVWQQSRAGNLPLGRWQSSGAASAVPLRLSAPHPVPADRTWIVAAWVAIIGWGGAGCVRRGYLEDPRWRPVLGLLAGIAWWLWLQPSALGWLLVAISVVLFVRRQGQANDV